jgi:hypothetical protein
MTDPQSTDNYDSPWKEALEVYFTECLDFFFPQAAEDIDWTKGYRFLDKELQQIAPDALTGRRTVDKLVEVWRESGDVTWVLIHLEVQSQYEPDFAERMYVYNYRLFDRYHQQVASFAILGDEHPNWRPTHYGYSLWDCEISLTFPVVKLLDYRERIAALEQHRNPFAVVVLAHLHTQATRGKPEERYALKWRLTRMLYERGYTKRDVLLLYRFIDWVMRLPTELTEQFKTRVITYEEERKMAYMTQTYQLVKEEGLEEGLQAGIQQGLQQGIQQKAREDVVDVLNIRFGIPAPAIIERINAIEDTEVLKTLHTQAVVAESFEEFRQFMEDLLSQPARTPAE